MKADARIEGNCRRTGGYSCPKLQLQETEQSETYGEYSSQHKKNNFMLYEGQDEISIYQTYFVFVPLFTKPIITRQIISSTKNSQEFLASQVFVLRRNKATNSSTSNLWSSISAKNQSTSQHSTWECNIWLDKDQHSTVQFNFVVLNAIVKTSDFNFISESWTLNFFPSTFKFTDQHCSRYMRFPRKVNFESSS